MPFCMFNDKWRSAFEVFGNYKEFKKALVSDLIDARDLWGTGKENQFYRRTYLRTIFAFVEGVIYARRLIINKNLERDNAEKFESHLSQQEMTLLSDDGFDIKKNGDVKVCPGKNRQPFLNYLRFIIKMYEKYMRLDLKITFNGEGWESFQSAYKVRNRITHPKNKNHLVISDQEMECIIKGTKWLVTSFA